MEAFADLDDEMQDALNDAYGERVLVEPQAPAGLRGRPITGGATRAPLEIVGRFRSKPATSELEGNREGSRFQSMTRIAGNVPTMRISPSEAARLGYALAANDRVVLVGRPDAPVFTIVRVGPRDTGELMLELTGEAALVGVTP